MDVSERLLKRNTEILEFYKKTRSKHSMKDSLKKTADKFFVSVHLVNQIVHNPKRNHSPLNQN